MDKSKTQMKESPNMKNLNHTELNAKIEEVVGYAMTYNSNSRYHFDNLNDTEYVLFRTQLNEDEKNEAGEVVSKDERVILKEMVLGDTATDKSRKAYCKLIEQNEPEIRELGMSMLHDGQMTPIWASKDGDGLHLIAGTRRLLAMWYAIALLPTQTAHLSKIRFTLTDPDNADVLSNKENRLRKELDVVSEAWQYYNYKTATGATAHATAVHFGLVNKTSGKPDAAKVSQLVRLWGPEVSDKVRENIRTGKVAWTTVMNRLTKGEDTEVIPEKGKRGRPSKEEAAKKAVAAKGETVAVEVSTTSTVKKSKIGIDDLATLADLLKKWEAANPSAPPVEYVRFGMCLATGKEYVATGSVSTTQAETPVVEAVPQTTSVA